MAASLSSVFWCFFFFWLSYCLGCYLTLAPSDFPQGIQPSPYPKDQQSDDAGHDSLSSLYSLLVDAKHLGHFSVGSCG